MLTKEYKVEEISYERKEDRRILEAVLKNWFKDPKLLNLVSPSLKYPFNFKEWLKIYSKIHTRSIILKVDNWIIGHLSIKQDLKSNRIHLFHLLIDPKHKRNGYGSKLINKAEEQYETICKMAQQTADIKKKRKIEELEEQDNLQLIEDAFKSGDKTKVVEMIENFKLNKGSL